MERSEICGIGQSVWNTHTCANGTTEWRGMNRRKGVEGMEEMPLPYTLYSVEFQRNVAFLFSHTICMYMCTYICIKSIFTLSRQLLEMFPEGLLQFCPKMVTVLLQVLTSALEYGTVNIKQVRITIALLILHFLRLQDCAFLASLCHRTLYMYIHICSMYCYCQLHK